MRDNPRVLITGACRGVGRACAEALAARGAALILCDKDLPALVEVAESLGAARHFCDVASEGSVATFAEEILKRYSSLDMVINAAGGGYERTLGTYRVSRALVPALIRGSHKILINVPPSPEDGDAAIFPYASSRLAFHRLSSALAFETQGASIAVLIGSPARGRLTQVLPDPNAGTWIETSDLGQVSRESVRTLAWQVASLIGQGVAPRRHAG